MNEVVYPPAQEVHVSHSINPISWFAVQTYPRHEKRAAQQLSQTGVDNYLPLMAQLHRWSDRLKKVELPLFPCYLFVRITPSAEEHVRVLKAGGVLGFVGAGRQGVPVPENQIEDIRTLLQNKIVLDPYPFLKIGQRVRIRGGCLDGIEGILVRRNGSRRLVISVDTLEKSLSVCIEGLEVQPI